MERLYSPLSAGRIRLIKHLDLDEDRQLRCDLDSYDLNGSEYIALSYTWGDPEHPAWRNSLRISDDMTDMHHAQRTLLVNDRHAVTLGTNLYSALTSAHILGHFEGEDRQRDNALWIDKICVDQSDAQDRNIQINQMDKIYTSAKWVTIWFGEEDSTTSRVVGMVTHIGQFAFADGERERRLGKYPGPMGDPPVDDDRLGASEMSRLGLENVTMKDWEMLLAFYQRTWFQRVWTVQESALSKGNWLMWGSYKFAWPSVIETAYFLMERSTGLTVRMKIDHPGPMTMRVLGAAQAISLVDGALRGPYKFAGWSKLWHHTDDMTSSGTLVLDFLLDITDGHRASDPRDKVFAVLGLLSKICNDFDVPPTEIKADYTKSTAQVFQDTTTAILRANSCLATVTRKGNSREVRLSGLPSWVCDYNCSEDETESIVSWQASEGISPAQPPFKASLEVKLGFSIEGGQLETYCWHFATVVCIGQACIIKDVHHRFEQDAALILAKMKMGTKASEAIPELYNVHDAFGSTLYGIEGKDRKLKFGRYIMGNCLEHKYEAYRSGASLTQVLASKSPQLLEVNLNDTEGWMPTLAEVDDYFDDLVRSQPDETLSDSALSEAAEMNVHHYRDTARVSQDKRRIVLLDQGSFGLAHQDVQVGDKMCIIPDGVRTPVILRPIEGIENEYYLIGEAFVDGIMYGEALDIMEERKETWDKICIV